MRGWLPQHWFYAEDSGLYDLHPHDEPFGVGAPQMKLEPTGEVETLANVVTSLNTPDFHRSDWLAFFGSPPRERTVNPAIVSTHAKEGRGIVTTMAFNIRGARKDVLVDHTDAVAVLGRCIERLLDYRSARIEQNKVIAHPDIIVNYIRPGKTRERYLHLVNGNETEPVVPVRVEEIVVKGIRHVLSARSVGTGRDLVVEQRVDGAWSIVYEESVLINDVIVIGIGDSSGARTRLEVEV